MKTNTSAIIFDFNRTLFDPESGSLYEGTEEILEKYTNTHDLFLISLREGDRQTLLQELNIGNYFAETFFVNEKTREVFETIGKGYQTVFVVGDRIASEITLGNQCGYTTIWIKQGKFKHVRPEGASQPRHIIHAIKELEQVIH